MTLYIVLMICNSSLPCDELHARAYRAYRAEPGQIVCGLPTATAGIVDTGLRPEENEFLVVKCRLSY